MSQAQGQHIRHTSMLKPGHGVSRSHPFCLSITAVSNNGKHGCTCQQVTQVACISVLPSLLLFMFCWPQVCVQSLQQVSQHCACYLKSLTCKCRRVNRISEDDISSDVNSSLHLQLTSHLLDPHSQAATLPRSTKPCVA